MKSVSPNAAFEQVRDKLKEEFVDLGEQSLKNIARPVRVYRVTLNRNAGKTEPALALPDKPSIAVLPFNNMSGDASQEFFADGIAEDITTLLSRLPGFFVIARNSAFTYKGRAVDARQVASELAVRYVLEGSVQKAGQRARVTAQLIEANFREPYLGGEIRSQRRRHLRRAGRDHPGHLCRVEAPFAPCGGRVRSTQTAAESRCLGIHRSRLVKWYYVTPGELR